MPVQNGVILYFDILGYQNLLSNNEPENIAETVIDRITSLNALVTEEVKKEFTNPAINKNIEVILATNHWLIFSDTVLLTNAFPDSESDLTRILRWFSILSMCQRIQSHMFVNGLPCRGVIHFGKFMVKDPCFAGRPIVEAYQLANTLELAATVMTEGAEQIFNQARSATLKGEKGSKVLDFFLERYLVPLKDGKEKHFLTLNYFPQANLTGKDIRQEVFAAFWQHRKDIPTGAQSKVENTEKHLRFLASLDNS